MSGLCRAGAGRARHGHTPVSSLAVRLTFQQATSGFFLNIRLFVLDEQIAKCCLKRKWQMSANTFVNICNSFGDGLGSQVLSIRLALAKRIQNCPIT